MVTGIDKTKTGSYDTYFDNQTSVQDNKGYAYLGIRNLPTPRPEFTWPSASKNDFNLRDLQMYTPYPTGTERGKLYWVDIATFVDTPGILDKEFYVELQTPPDNQYYIITPSLNASGLSTGGHIAQYGFYPPWGDSIAE